MNLAILDSEELIALAQRDMQSNQYTDALIKLKTAVSVAGCPPSVYALLGRIHAELQLFPKALANFQRFLDAVPDALHERFELGMVLHSLGDQEAALGEWNEVLAYSKDYPPALFYKALHLLDTGEAQQALGLFSKLLATAASDNLYVERAKEIIRAIDSNASIEEKTQKH